MKIYRFPDCLPLEDCLKSFIRVSWLSPSGLSEIRGMLLQLVHARHVFIARFPAEEDNLPLNMADGVALPFVGGDGAILRIEQGNRLAFSNPHLPRPYPEYDLRREDDLQAVNDLRLARFGLGYSIESIHLADIED